MHLEAQSHLRSVGQQPPYSTGAAHPPRPPPASGARGHQQLRHAAPGSGCDYMCSQLAGIVMGASGLQAICRVCDSSPRRVQALRFMPLLPPPLLLPTASLPHCCKGQPPSNHAPALLTDGAQWDRSLHLGKNSAEAKACVHAHVQGVCRYALVGGRQRHTNQVIKYGGASANCASLCFGGQMGGRIS